MSVQVKGSGTIGGLDEGLNIVGVVTATSFDGNITGTVGVGTDNPQSVLHVANTNTTVWPFSTSVSAGPAYTPYPHELVIDNDVRDVTGSFAGIYFNAGGYGTTTGVSRVSTARIAAIDTGDYKADLAFSTRGFGNSNHKEHLRINSSGQMGLGTNNPNANFHIKSTFPAIRLEDDSDYSQIDANGGSLRLLADAGNASSNSNILFSVDGDERLRIDSNGDMALGGLPITSGYTSFTIHESGTNSGDHVRFNMTNGNTGNTGSDGFSITVNASTKNVHLIQRETADMVFQTAGSERLRITSDGYVTKPAHPWFQANSTPTNSSNVAINFGNVNQSSGNHYNNSTGRFTAPVAGFYHFSCGIWSDAASTTQTLVSLTRYDVSASNAYGFAASNGVDDNDSMNVSGGIYLDVNDYVYVALSNVTIKTSTPRNFFSGHLVG